MARLRRGTQTAFSETASLRLRAAWLYYNHGLTQKTIADQLGISRTTVIRLLDEALKRSEVRIWIDEGEAHCVELALKLERALGLDEAIVVPGAEGIEQSAKSVGLALGKFLSEAIDDDMVIGVGWGRTLTASLASFRPPRRAGVKVLSLLGGSTDAQFTDPVEFSWRMAGQLGAECYLFPAPLVVDSAETKRRLIDFCGIDRIYELAEALDLAVVSVGDVSAEGTSLARALVGHAEHGDLVALGCVGDLMCNFFDAEGRTVPHPLAARVMSISLETLARAGHIVIACGGAHRAVAIRAAIKRVGCNTLVTDEGAAIAMLALG